MNAYSRCIASVTKKKCSVLPKADPAKASAVIVKLASAFYLKPDDVDMLSRNACPPLPPRHDCILLSSHLSDHDDFGYELTTGGQVKIKNTSTEALDSAAYYPVFSVHVLLAVSFYVCLMGFNRVPV
jgi:hypothetical protein